MEQIILYDGDCHLCDRSIRFIRRKDSHNRFRCIKIKSSEGEQALQKFSLPVSENSSVILIKNGSAYFRSSAVLHIVRQLSGLIRIVYLGIAIPKGIRDCIYDYISRNRYKWFGTNACSLPEKINLKSHEEQNAGNRSL